MMNQNTGTTEPISHNTHSSAYCSKRGVTVCEQPVSAINTAVLDMENNLTDSVAYEVRYVCLLEIAAVSTQTEGLPGMDRPPRNY